jgi:hypothetical protein
MMGEILLAGAVGAVLGAVFAAWRLKGSRSLTDTMRNVVVRGGGGPGAPQ